MFLKEGKRVFCSIKSLQKYKKEYMPCGGHFTKHKIWFDSSLIPALISDALIIVNIISHTKKVSLCLRTAYPKFVLKNRKYFLYALFPLLPRRKLMWSS